MVKANNHNKYQQSQYISTIIANIQYQVSIIPYQKIILNISTHSKISIIVGAIAQIHPYQEIIFYHSKISEKTITSIMSNYQYIILI